MTSRRNLVLGALCVCGAAGGYAFTPRKTLSLLGTLKLNDITPMKFGAWEGRDVSDLVAPAEADSLQSRLYGQTIERIYTETTTGESIMMLMAHGDSQTNDLQLHRPEVCYPAFGFTIRSSVAAVVDLQKGAKLPVRELVAEAPERRESIVYWTRLGESLPTNLTEQRAMRFEASLHGYVADGLLARFSSVGSEPDKAFSTIRGFIADLLAATKPDQRPAFIGTRMANASSVGIRT